MPEILDVLGSPMSQLDGHTPHWGIDVQWYLDTKGGQRCIERRGPIALPARLPNMTPSGLYMCKFKKYYVSSAQMTSPPQKKKTLNKPMQL